MSFEKEFCPMGICPYLFNFTHGIDTLVMTYKLVGYKNSESGSMPSDLGNYLNQAQKEARKQKTRVEVFGKIFEIFSFGDKSFRYRMFNDELTVKIPQYVNYLSYFYVEFRSEYLKKYGVHECLKRVDDWLKNMADIEEGIVNRADPYVDIREDTKRFLENKEVMRFIKWRDNHLRTKDTGKEFGRGDLQLRIYDKKAEMGKSFSCLYENEEVCTRVEFQLRRRYINSMGIKSFSIFEQALPAIWYHLTNDIYRHIKDENEIVSRCEMTEIWSKIAGMHFKIYLVMGEISVNLKKKEVKDENLLNMSIGIISSLEMTDDKEFESDEEYLESYLKKVKFHLLKTGKSIKKEIEKKKGKVFYQGQLELKEK